MLLNYQEVFRHNILIARSCEQVEIGAMSRKQSHGTAPSLSFWFTMPFGHDSELFTITPVTDLCPSYFSKVAPVSSPSSIPGPLTVYPHPPPKKVNTLE